jgi:hypothetical protein
MQRTGCAGDDMTDTSPANQTSPDADLAQACLMLQFASPEASAAFIGSRFDPDWGPMTGISSGTSDQAALLRAAWQ